MLRLRNFVPMVLRMLLGFAIVFLGLYILFRGFTAENTFLGIIGLAIGIGGVVFIFYVRSKYLHIYGHSSGHSKHSGEHNVVIEHRHHNRSGGDGFYDSKKRIRTGLFRDESLFPKAYPRKRGIKAKDIFSMKKGRRRIKI